MIIVKRSGKKDHFRYKICAILVVFFSFFGPWVNMLGAPGVSANEEEAKVVVFEIRYEKLMKLYLNKIKLAFSEPEDGKLLAILHQFQPEFNQKAETLRQALKHLVKDMSPDRKAKVYAGLAKYSHADEMIALLFDERITTRLDANPEIKQLMDALHTKSLEIPKPE